MVSIQEGLSLNNLAILIPATVPRIVLIVGHSALSLSVDRLHFNDGPAILAYYDAFLPARDFELVAWLAEQEVNVSPGGVVVGLLGCPCA